MDRQLKLDLDLLRRYMGTRNCVTEADAREAGYDLAVDYCVERYGTFERAQKEIRKGWLDRMLNWILPAA